MDFSHTLSKNNNRCSGMRGAAPRFRGHGGEQLGLYMSTPDRCGPGHYTQHKQWSATPFERKEAPLVKCPTSPQIGASRSLDDSSFRSASPRIPKTKASGNPTFYDLDAAGGKKVDFGKSATKRHHRYSLMRDNGRQRFDPLVMTHVGPGTYDTIREWPLEGGTSAMAADLQARDPTHANSVFCSESLRIPEGKDSWVLLRSIESEPGGAPPEHDAQLWQRKPYVGRRKGAPIGKAERKTGLA